MSNLQNFLVANIPSAVAEAEAALMNLPEDKRDWSAGGTARSALDTLAEIAIVNGSAADMLETRQGMANFDLEQLEREKAVLRADWSALKSLLDTNTARVGEAIRNLSDEDLKSELQMPWGPMSLEQIAAYPYWNARYHEGQINFIAAILGCLK